MVDLQNLAGDLLDLEEHAVQARLLAPAEIERDRGACAGVGEELVPLAAIVVAAIGQLGQPVPFRLAG